MYKKLEGGLQYIADGWKAVLTKVRGGWEFVTQVFQIPRWDGAVNMCWVCSASSTIKALAFYNCSRAAGWRRTRRTHEAYVREKQAAGETLPALFLFCIGLRLECLCIDILHCVDQGVASHIIM